MRSLLVLLIIFSFVPAILAKPHVGVLLWSWISYMNPHRLTWGAASNFPVADVVAGGTILALVFSREKKAFLGHPLLVLLLVYAIWVTITTLFAVAPEYAWGKWERTEKILLFAFITAALITSRSRLTALIWVTVLSLGYFGLKGGAFTILGGGKAHVFGPPGSFIADNNALALALIMTLPLMRFLHLQEKRKYLKWALAGSIVLTLFAVFGSQSRGAFLALAAMLTFMALKSRRRGFAILTLIVALGIGVAFMPETWKERMTSITQYENDPSAVGRIVMWKFAIDLAADHPIVGGGFLSFYDEGLRQKYLPPETRGRNVHSIYFEALGEHGYVGLLLFLAIGFGTYFTASRIVRETRRRPELHWARDLASMLQVSLVGYAAGGAFLNLGTFDLYYQLVVLVVITRLLVKRALGTEASARAWHPATWTRAGAPS